MSTLNVNELNAPADHNFEIKVDDGELLNIDGTLGLNPLSHFKLPVGTTAQRPTSPVAGQIRYNSTLETVEGYNGTDWITLMASAAGASSTSSADIVRKNLVMWLDANNPRSLMPNSTDQDANYWYDISGNNFHCGIPTDRYAQESINGQLVKYMDFSVNGSG